MICLLILRLLVDIHIAVFVLLVIECSQSNLEHQLACELGLANSREDTSLIASN